MNAKTTNMAIPRPAHGGGLSAMVKQYDRPLEDWIDLSTGVNPHAYSVTKVPARAWSALPDEDGLLEAAQRYYQCKELLMVPGSQWAISMLPRLLQDLTDGSEGTVLLPAQGYREHVYEWLQAGYKLAFYQDEPSPEQINDCDVCVVINPNNPTGKHFEREQVETIYEDCRDHGALLIVDEAFVDLKPEQSMSALAGLPDLIVLRSLGKFFGLAGVRVGAVCAWPPMLAALESYLPPWSIPGPSRYAAVQALSDADWIEKMLVRLAKQGEKLVKLLAKIFELDSTGTALFQTVYLDQDKTANATWWFEQLAKRGIAVRLLDDQDGLRFGLPSVPKAWKRVEEALLEVQVLAAELDVQDERGKAKEEKAKAEKEASDAQPESGLSNSEKSDQEKPESEKSSRPRKPRRKRGRSKKETEQPSTQAESSQNSVASSDSEHSQPKSESEQSNSPQNSSSHSKSDKPKRTRKPRSGRGRQTRTSKVSESVEGNSEGLTEAQASDQKTGQINSEESAQASLNSSQSAELVSE